MVENCLSIKNALTEHLLSHVEVQQVGDICVATLPFSTLDRRWVDVFIENREADFFLIHDGGKAVNELILQGMKITLAVEREFQVIASRFGVAYQDEMFRTGAKSPHMAASAYEVGMASALAMTRLLQHVPVVEEEPLTEQVRTLLRRWGRGRAKVTENATVAGEIKQHTFDFLLSPRQKGATIGVSILNPTGGPLAAAERFGFKAKDLEPTRYRKWQLVAVETKAEVWSRDARDIVRKCANVVIPIQSDDRPTYDQISQALAAVA